MAGKKGWGGGTEGNGEEEEEGVDDCHPLVRSLPLIRLNHPRVQAGNKIASLANMENLPALRHLDVSQNRVCTLRANHLSRTVAGCHGRLWHADEADCAVRRRS